MASGSVGNAKGVGVGSGVGKTMAVAVGSGVGKVTGVAVGSGVGSAMGVGVGSGVGKVMGVAVGSARGAGNPATAVAIFAVVVASISSAEGPHPATTPSAASMMRTLAAPANITPATPARAAPAQVARVAPAQVALVVRPTPLRQLHLRVQAKRPGRAAIRIDDAPALDPQPPSASAFSVSSSSGRSRLTPS